MTGYDADEIIGSNCRFLQGSGTDMAVIAEVRAAIAERRDFATEILNYRKDGYAFWNGCSCRRSTTRPASSSITSPRSSTSRDAARPRTTCASRRRWRRWARLTGGIAHDFNNLLQVMVGYLELIDAGLSKPEFNTPKLKRNIGNARAAADRAAALTQQLPVVLAQAAARRPHPQPERHRARLSRPRRPHPRR